VTIISEVSEEIRSYIYGESVFTFDWQTILLTSQISSPLVDRTLPAITRTAITSLYVMIEEPGCMRWLNPNSAAAPSALQGRLNEMLNEMLTVCISDDESFSERRSCDQES